MAVEYLTLADYAADPEPLVAGVAKGLRENSRFMDILPFYDMGSLSIKVVHEGEMPEAVWREKGVEHGSVKAAKPKETEEFAYSIGNQIKVDVMDFNDRRKRLYNPMTYQTNLITKSIARGFCHAAINGLPTDLKNPVGLHYRTNNDLDASQKINGNGLDISPDAVGLAANIQAYFDFLDQLLYTLTDSIEQANEVFLLTNDTVILRHQSIARQSGSLNTVKDALGRTFTDYKGARFVDMGRKFDDVTRIIGNTELNTGAALTGGAATSIYGVRVGKEYFTAWQEYGMKVYPPELQPDKVTLMSVIDWVPGIAVSHPRYSVARFHGLVAL